MVLSMYCTCIVEQGPGVTFAFARSRVRPTSTSEIQFNFASDVLLSGIIISTNNTNYLQARYLLQSGRIEGHKLEQSTIQYSVYKGEWFVIDYFTN